MKKVIFGLVTSEDVANKIVDHLTASGLSTKEISVVYPDTKNKYTTTTSAGQVTLNKGAKKGASGEVFSGSLGTLSHFDALTIPGFGTFVIAGPIVSLLSGAPRGGTPGLLVGALAGSGISETDAKKYETALRAGTILICVHPTSDETVTRAIEILKKDGAKDVTSTKEKAKTSY